MTLLDQRHEIRERRCLKRIAALVRSVKDNNEDIYNCASRLRFRSDGDPSSAHLAQVREHHRCGEADVDARVAPEELAAGLDGSLAIELDPHAIAQEVLHVIGEVRPAKRRRRTPHDLE